MAEWRFSAPGVLEKLAQFSKQFRLNGSPLVEKILIALAENQQTPPESLPKLAKRGSVEIDLALAKNPKTDFDILFELLQNDSQQVRLKASENPNIPDQFKPISVLLVKCDTPLERFQVLQAASAKSSAAALKPAQPPSP